MAELLHTKSLVFLWIWVLIELVIFGRFLVRVCLGKAIVDGFMDANLGVMYPLSLFLSRRHKEVGIIPGQLPDSFFFF